MDSVVIAGYARSPFHLAGKGALSRVRPDDLAAQVIRGLIDRTKFAISNEETRYYLNGIYLHVAEGGTFPMLRAVFATRRGESS